MADRAKQVEDPAAAARGTAQKSDPVRQTGVAAPRSFSLQARSVREPPGLTRPAEILAVQQAAGNRAVMRLLAARRPAAENPTTGPAPVVQAQLEEDLEEESVQRRADGWHEPSDAEIHSAAAKGMSTPATTLPYLDRIQASFGRHPVGHIKAHIGSEAAEASRAMNARAFASGDHVVFGAAADLRTAAHEAAHVVQQRAGVQLAGGIGREGDAYEHHADAVADAVVAGRSAEGLLEPFAALPTPPSRPTAHVTSSIQCSLRIIKSKDGVNQIEGRPDFTTKLKKVAYRSAIADGETYVTKFTPDGGVTFQFPTIHRRHKFAWSLWRATVNMILQRGEPEDMENLMKHFTIDSKYHDWDSLTFHGMRQDAAYSNDLEDMAKAFFNDPSNVWLGPGDENIKKGGGIEKSLENFMKKPDSKRRQNVKERSYDPRRGVKFVYREPDDDSPGGWESDPVPDLSPNSKRAGTGVDWALDYLSRDL